MAKFFKRKKKKMRLRPDANPENSTMYQYARQAYEQNMEPAYSNSDDRGIVYDEEASETAQTAARGVSPTTSAHTSASAGTMFLSPNGSDTSHALASHHQQQEAGSGASNNNNNNGMQAPSSTFVSDHSSHSQQQQQYSQDYEQQQQQQQHPYNHYYSHNKQQYPSQEPEMVDSTYEETYGDAYVGAPIRYVYPSGYQSMRPRGGPWKLSIAVTVLFTWLSVFIVGHCSEDDVVANDDYNYDNNNNNNNNNNEYNYQKIDDDRVLIETRWCGSRMLYFMWVMSMLITGLAAAYCSVIGYIKVRDFAVANCRSQPPGMVGKSDYYVRISDLHKDGGGNSSPGSARSTPQYQQSIYQADGTPQFWGGHIYRPTQAAVAVTSR